MTAMRPIEREFQKRGSVRGGVLFLSPHDALDMVACARQEHIQVLGIDGFFLRDEETEPSMQNSIDLTVGRNLDDDSWSSAERFLQQRVDSGMYFEVVLE